MRSRGLDMSALPMASICCSPPDMVPAACFLLSLSRGKSSIHLILRLFDEAPLPSVDVCTQLQVLLHGHLRERASFLPDSGRSRV